MTSFSQSIRIVGPELGKAAVCEPILRALPDWFGMEEGLLIYREEIEALPTFLACAGAEVLGFLSIKQHYPASAEVYVMGIRPEVHRQGLGRALMQAAQDWLRGQGVEYLQVKTLGMSHPDVGYSKTRAFYLALGFIPLEEFPQIWGPDNPCLILVKRL